MNREGEKPMSHFWLVGVLVLSLGMMQCGPKKESEVSTSPKESPAEGGKGMVSTAHPLATEAGVEVLKKGGNAFDAAVAVASTLNVVEPYNSGVGGYGTIVLYHASTQKSWFLDSSGKIPQAVDSDVFRPPTPGYKENRRGAKAVSTPGNVNAWESLHQKYGNLEWTELFQKAIHLAQEGFVTREMTARAIARTYSTFSSYSQDIYGKNGTPLKKGQKLIQKDLGKSLSLIAQNGAGVVYGGEIGQAMHMAMEKKKGFLTLDDLKKDRAEWWEPISISYRGYKVLTASPPSTAFPSLIRLGLMSQWNLQDLGHNSVDYLHRFAEVTKHAYGCRLKYAGDPEIDPPPLDKLLSESYWREQVKKIDPQKAHPFEPPRLKTRQGKNTTHFVVADQWGNIVSATQTLGNTFGSRIMPEGTGIWLNNSLAYCTFEPEGNPMDAHPGQRKLSGDCPTLIMHENKPWMALGTPGGHTIGQTVPQMVMNIIDFGMNIQEAISAPRVSFVEPDKLAVEKGIPQPVREKLGSMGHNVQVVRSLGNAHGLSLEYDFKGNPKRFFGGSDPRGQGKAEGVEKPSEEDS
ncbi:gamma-glutamyltransferase [bacterium]|nr:gamma-glutamyltransferase [bacterium]